MPIAAYADLNGSPATLWLRGRVGSENGQTLLKAEHTLALTGTQAEQENQAEQVGITVAEDLLAQGADEILKAIYATDA